MKADIPSAPAITKNSSGDDSGLPAEVGVYAKKKGEWVEVMPEVVNWKTGGVMKSVATAGVVKGDPNGHLNGKHSHNSVTLPTEFLIVLRGEMRSRSFSFFIYVRTAATANSGPSREASSMFPAAPLAIS